MFNPIYYFRPESKPFVFTVKTDNAGSASTKFQLPLIASGTYNFTVDKGNGDPLVAINLWNSPSTLLDFGIAGTYTVTIRGTINGWQFANTGDRLKLLSITKWGKLKTGNLSNVFYGCANLNLTVVQDVLDLTGITNLNGFFRNCTSLTNINRVNEWNTSSVQYMSFMFAGTPFNNNIGAWNVYNVLTFNSMFFSATAFNNSGLSDINNWSIKTTGTVNMGQMFSIATTFNQNIGGWNTSAVTDMNNMFSSATAFNQNIGSWNTGAVTDMSSMFSSATTFNQNIGSWNVSKVLNFAEMFRNATAFNQNIGSWNTGAVTDMSSMFRNVTSFNQPIGNWNTSAVTSMGGMFYNTTNFNQNIGGWNISNVLNFTNFMFNKTNLNYSTTNMDALLNGWIINELKPTLTILFGSIARTSASDESRRLMNGTSTTKAVTNAVNNGSGLIRITAVGHGLTTNNKVFIKGIVGTIEANGLATITVIDADNFDIQGSAFTNAYIIGGTVITQYGWLGLPA